MIWLLACGLAPTEAASTPEPVPVAERRQPTGPRGKAGLPGGGPRGPRGAGSISAVTPDPSILAGDPVPGTTPPIDFFYAVHAHMSGEHLPYHDQGMTQLDEQRAANMLATLDAIASTADRYGVKLTLELVSGTAKGLAEHDPGVWDRLRKGGHEIGLHTHSASRLTSTAQVIEKATGARPTVGSGVLAWSQRSSGASAKSGIASHLGQVEALGMTVASVNFSPGDRNNPLAESCSSFGEGNGMWSVTGNLLFPWRPSASDPCVHDPSGSLVLVDHVPMSGMLVAGRIADVLDDTSFAQLTTWFDNALTYMDLYKPEEPAAWGFVTHLTEYVPGRDATSGPDASAVAALDRFLAHVHSQQQAGLVRYATVGEIAEKVP